MTRGCRTCGPNELMGADFIGYDAPPAIVGKPGETISLPIFVSHFSERSHPVQVRWWVSGYDSRADIRTVVEPRSFPITWRPYDVVDLEPLKITLPDYPFVGAVDLDPARRTEPSVRGQFRQSGGEARTSAAANQAAE